MLCQIITDDFPSSRKETETPTSFRPSAYISKFLKDTRKAVVYNMNNNHNHNVI